MHLPRCDLIRWFVAYDTAFADEKRNRQYQRVG